MAASFGVSSAAVQAVKSAASPLPSLSGIYIYSSSPPPDLNFAHVKFEYRCKQLKLSDFFI